MTRLQRMHAIRDRNAQNQRKRDRIRQAQMLADLTGQPQVVVRDPRNNEPRIMQYAHRESQPGGITIWPNQR